MIFVTVKIVYTTHEAQESKINQGHETTIRHECT